MSEAEVAQGSKYRRLSRRWRLVAVALPSGVTILAICQLFHWRPFGLMLVDLTYLYLLVGGFLPLCFLWIRIGSKAPRASVPWYDVVFMALSLAIPLYFGSRQYQITTLGWETRAPTIPFILSTILWVLLIEAARRAAGRVFGGVVLFFSIYPLFASYMPGFLWSPASSLKQVASYHFFSQESLMGLVLHTFGRLLFGYMVFAVALQAIGAGRFFNNLALVLIRKTRASNAKVAIIASALFGTISGSPISNVMTVGTFTIPAMQKEGLPPHFAAAVEACASSGGTLMPPIMGVAAFIMAEFLKVPYAQVCLAAAVPSFLYYACLFFQIDSFAGRIGLKPRPLSIDAPPIWRTLIDHLHIILSFIVLLLVLFFLRLESQAPWIATAVALVIGMFRKESRTNLKSLIGLIENTGKVLGELMGVLGPLGLIIGSLVFTGVAFSLPNEIVRLAGGNVVLLLLFAAVACLILGMGVTTSAVYIFLALVAAPGLITFGFDPMAVHLFILYCAVFSNITPPVALAAFAAASLAGSDPMKTGFQAMKLGIAKYILPFVFITSPELILHGQPTDIVRAVSTAFIGLMVISGALEGYFWGIGKLTLVMRVLLFGTGMLLAIDFHTYTFDLYGMGALVVLYGLAYFVRGRKAS